MSKLKQRVDQLRDQGKTCQEIADMFGVTRQYIHKISTGYSDRSIRRFPELSKLTNVILADLGITDIPTLIRRVDDLSPDKINVSWYGESKYRAIQRLVKNWSDKND